jgi:uncharacterized protein (DUF433 family)
VWQTDQRLKKVSDRGLPSARISSTRFSELVMKIQQILDRQGIVHSDPEIMSGVPVFVGTRVPLQTFFDYLEGESGLAEFLEDFPHLKNTSIASFGSDRESDATPGADS